MNTSTMERPLLAMGGGSGSVATSPRTTFGLPEDPDEGFDLATDDPDARASLDVGMWVRCERSQPSAGTWPRFAGRVGRIVVVNESEFGVRFTANTAESPYWFLADELVEVERPSNAPNGRTSSERKAV